MDDHKDNPTESNRREESVLEQRYKELYGAADAPPEAAADAGMPDSETPLSAPEDIAGAAGLSEAAAGLPEDAPAEAFAAPAPEKRAARRAASWEEDTPPPRPPRKEPARASSSKETPPSPKAKPSAPRTSGQEPAARRAAPGQRVDTLERSQVRRGYGQPPQRQMKLWPWLLAGGILVLALVGLLLYSMLRPIAAPPQKLAADTPAPTGIPAGFFGQATLAPTTDLSALLPTPGPTAEPTPIPGTPTPDTSLILRPGTSGESVRQLQRRLIELGYMAPGTDDGDYGNTTQSAVVAFQKAHDLTADGYAGSQTLTILYSNEAKAAPAATATPNPEA